MIGSFVIRPAMEAVPVVLVGLIDSEKCGGADGSGGNVMAMTHITLHVLLEYEKEDQNTNVDADSRTNALSRAVFISTNQFNVLNAVQTRGTHLPETHACDRHLLTNWVRLPDLCIFIKSGNPHDGKVRQNFDVLEQEVFKHVLFVTQ